ncbi:sulfurtransferase TusA family protein [Shimia biformata]|uniref:sulfurtransferase TusA family protein n=1 Tax=Shimia biformata TaxID=1294299 RepID=UPI001950A793|nr:sulfurtransferase TusA family protein [Shimia biformata]
MSDDIHDEIDAIGLLCPLPVLKLRKRLKAVAPGAAVRLLADDPAAIVDVPHFCNESGHSLVTSCENDGTLEFVVRRKA